MELIEPVQMNIPQSNTYRNDISWLHFNDERRVQERQQVKDQQSCISVFTPVLTGYSENFPFRTTWSRVLLRKVEIMLNLTQNSIILKFMKTNSITDPAVSLVYINCYSSKNCRSIKSPCTSIRYDCKKNHISLGD